MLPNIVPGRIQLLAHQPPTAVTEHTQYNPGYCQQRVSLLTQHGKELVIAPVLNSALGCEVVRVDGFDTDTLGSFTLEIPRAGTQMEAARKKARMGMTLSGLPLGLASEGSFGPDPFAGMMPWNLELLIFIDDMRGIEVVGRAQGSTRHVHLVATDWAQLETFAHQAGFPEHHLVLRPAGEGELRIRKGITTWPELSEAFTQAQAQSAQGQVILENDLRAHAHPTRQGTIKRAAEDLAARLQSLCPSCHTPGFWTVDRIAGLPCGACGVPTRETRAEVLACLKCDHQETRACSGSVFADPSRCGFCNP